MFRCDKGITLIEVAIVLAIIAAISAILIPSFLGTTMRAKLRADVQSAKVITNALNLYNVEQPALMNKTTVSDILAELKSKGYLKNQSDTPQTHTSVTWFYDSAQESVFVDLTNSDQVPNIGDAYSALTAEEKKWVKGSPTTPTPTQTP